MNASSPPVEYAGGVATMMTGSSAAHATIATNFVTDLRQALRGSSCRSFGSDMKIIANGTVRYPDVSVTCRPIGDRDGTVPDPVFVVEVISPSTEREDRGRKKFDYFATSLVRHYAIVEQDARCIDLYTRAGEHWTDEVVEGNAVLKLTALGIEIGLDAIYEGTALDPARQDSSGLAG
ncbi:MAG TPA: Uma2 family endonuclease [Stellaceae bacterium]|nr:Uma2 family endonuclease [Stellaceae bacterium]